MILVVVAENGKRFRIECNIEQVADRYDICDVGPQHNFLMRKGRPVIYDLGV